MRAIDYNFDKMNDNAIHALAMKDDELYAELFLKIRTKEASIAPLIYNEPQQMLNKLCEGLLKDNGRVQVINLKARQMGLSTAIQGRGFKRATTSELYTMQAVSHDDDSVIHLLNMSKLYLQELPKQLVPMMKYQPKTALEFANPYPQKGGGPGLRSHIKVATSRNTRVGRSDTINFGHLSEMGFWDREPEKLLTSFMQAMPSTGQTPLKFSAKILPSPWRSLLIVDLSRGTPWRSNSSASLSSNPTLTFPSPSIASVFI